MKQDRIAWLRSEAMQVSTCSGKDPLTWAQAKAVRDRQRQGRQEGGRLPLLVLPCLAHRLPAEHVGQGAQAMEGCQMKIRSVPRWRDEQVLWMLRQRQAGKSLTWIERRLGIAQGLAAQATVAVMRADLAESGEPEGLVRRAYW